MKRLEFDLAIFRKASTFIANACGIRANSLTQGQALLFVLCKLMQEVTPRQLLCASLVGAPNAYEAVLQWLA